MKNEYFPAIAFGILFLLALAPWFYFQTGRVMQADSIFLTYAAEQVLAGKAMTDTYFDNNPPMSYIIYTPSAMLKSFGLEFWQTHLVYVFFLIGIGALFFTYFLSKLEGIHRSLKFALSLSYVFATTMPMLYEFGQKDHLIAIALLPFIFAQLNLLQNERNGQPALKSRAMILLALVFYTPFILIKPHYGLIPTALILYRWYATKSFRSIFREDFFILAAGVIGYAAVILTMFPEFIDPILPLSVQVYISNSVSTYKPHIIFIYLFFCICLGIFALCLNNDRPKEKELVLTLCIAGLLSIVPAWVQAKGFSLHFLPFIVIGIVSAATLTLLYTRDLAPVLKAGLLVTTLSFIAVLGFLSKPAEKQTHAHFKNYPFMAELGINENTRSFFIENNSTNVIYPIALYNNIKNASRFPSNWLVANTLLDLEEEERLKVYDIIGNAFAEDIEQNKPEIILLLNDKNFAGYLLLLREHPKIKEALDNYLDPEPFITDVLYFYSSPDKREEYGSQTYNLYRRKESDP